MATYPSYLFEVDARVSNILYTASLSVTEIDSLGDISQARDAHQCSDAFRRALRRYEPDKFACGEIDLKRRQRAVFYGMHWSEAWKKFYLENLYLERDPLLRFIETTDDSFTWSELRHSARLTADERDIFKTLERLGWVDGFVLPIPKSGSHKGLVSVVCKHALDEKEDKTFLSLAAFCYFFRVRSIVTEKDFPVLPFGLTRREFECLTLVANGMSDREIANALGISLATASEHVKGAMSRMEASTRSEAVAIASSFGAIRL